MANRPGRGVGPERAARRCAFGCALAAALAGCAVGPNYHAPASTAPGSFVAAAPAGGAGAEAPVAVPGGLDLTQWWQSLHDTVLDALIARAIRANPDIEIVLTRLQEARTGLIALVGTELPEAGASAAGGRGTGSDLSRAGAARPLESADNRGALSQISQVAGFAASWEIDLFGGNRRAIEAARYDVQAAAATRNAVLLGVVGDLARSYVALRGLQLRLAILRENIASATQSRDLEQIRLERGITNELDLQLAIRELSSLRSQLPPVQGAVQDAQYRIAVLLGQYPEELAAELASPGELPTLPGNVGPGLPVELLARRPDVRAAERALAAATARIGVATANLFPRIVLTGGIGTQSANLGAHGSHIWDFGPALYWPLLDFGALDAQVSVADLQAHERAVQYRKTLIDAVMDADTAIADYGAQQQRLASLAPAMLASQRALSLAQQRYDRGLTDFLNVVDAERAQYDLEDKYVQAQQSTAEAFIYLCQALGGGWEPYQQVPPIRLPEPAVLAGFHRLLAGDNPQR
jgi:NodT family efflux transporter outer membrane factor (OMF) lipoprotein